VTELSPGTRAVNTLEIEDVFLVETHCWVQREFNSQALIPEVVFGIKSDVEPEVLIQERTPIAGGESFCVARYFVRADMRIVKPGVTGEQLNDAPKEDIWAEFRFIFAADYRCPKEFNQDLAAVGAFTRNAQFHVWPYFREEVHATCGRLRLPRVTLQMLKPDQAQPAAPESGTS
jgi:hypothetical protein